MHKMFTLVFLKVRVHAGPGIIREVYPVTTVWSIQMGIVAESMRIELQG